MTSIETGGARPSIPLSYLCLIPARGGSKGVPGKNLREVGGRPLLAWSIGHAAAIADREMRVVVSTDDDRIGEAAELWGAEAPFRRPAALSGDSAPTEAAIGHALAALHVDEVYVPDALVLLQATSPVRFAGTLRAAIERFETSGADSLLSVSEVHPFLWSNPDDATSSYDPRRRPMRQALTESDRVYVENGSIYITTIEAFKSSGCRTSGRVVLLPLAQQEALDIDTLDDLWLADLILSNWSDRK